jgi:hypothetical protein
VTVGRRAVEHAQVDVLSRPTRAEQHVEADAAAAAVRALVEDLP